LRFRKGRLVEPFFLLAAFADINIRKSGSALRLPSAAPAQQ
jgi:hypothetical protein